MRTKIFFHAHRNFAPCPRKGNEEALPSSPYAQSVNSRDVIAGGFSKRGFIVLHDIEERVRPKTLIVSYGESGRRRVALGMGSTTEVILQLVSAETGELVGTATAEGCGDTESDDIKQAITRALAALFK